MMLRDSGSERRAAPKGAGPELRRARTTQGPNYAGPELRRAQSTQDPKYQGPDDANAEGKNAGHDRGSRRESLA